MQLEAVGDAAGDGERRAGLPTLDLAEHRRADAAALGEVAEAEVHRLAQRADAGPDVHGWFDGGHGAVRYHVQT